MDRLKSSVTCLTRRRSKALSSVSAAAARRSLPDGGGVGEGVGCEDLIFVVASRLAEKDILNRDINGLRGVVDEEDTGR